MSDQEKKDQAHKLIYLPSCQWNTWRELQRSEFGGNSQDYNRHALTDLHFNDTELETHNLSDLDFYKLVAQRSSLVDGNMRGSSFCHSTFDSCSLHNINMKRCQAHQTSFRHSNMGRAMMDFTKFFYCRFYECNLNGLSLRSSRINNCHFQCQQAKLIDFEDTELTNVDLCLSARVYKCQFLRAALYTTRIVTDFLYQSNFTKATILNANFITQSIKCCDFIRATIQNTNFMGPDGTQTNNKISRISDAKFRGAALDNVNFSGVKFENVHFIEANLNNVNFTDASFDENCTFNRATLSNIIASDEAAKFIITKGKPSIVSLHAIV
jgi:uncharacterized protein YjbI with pentapeptide repeats